MTILGFNNALRKQPSEILSIRTEWADVAASLILSGYVINAVDLTVLDGAGNNSTSAMVSGSATIDANNHYVSATIKNGSDGKDYFARFKTTWTKSTQPDQIVERDLMIEVREKGF
jgi:hypothetical protein